LNLVYLPKIMLVGIMFAGITSRNGLFRPKKQRGSEQLGVFTSWRENNAACFPDQDPESDSERPCAVTGKGRHFLFVLTWGYETM